MNVSHFVHNSCKDTKGTDRLGTQVKNSTIGFRDVKEKDTSINDLNFDKENYNNQDLSSEDLPINRDTNKGIIIDSITGERNQNLPDFENSDFNNFFYNTDFAVKESSEEVSKDTADFSLDMVTADMDFEQVYSMYNSIQQKDALNAVDELKKLQMLNQQYVTVLPSNFDPTNLPNDKLDFHRSQILTGSINFQQKNNMEVDSGEPRSFGEGDDMEFDQFFSHTESNALEKFLDNLANPANSDPLQFYNNYNTKHITGDEVVSQLFDLHTMKPTAEYKKSLKSELTEAFGEPLMNSLKSISSSSSPTHEQLPTPCESRNSSLIRNNLHAQPLNTNEKSFSVESSFSPSEPSPKRRRRVSHKPLLSLEQKRLNHSTSEQRRRQLCKLAYERCLKLVVNMEEYCKEANMNKKSKRAKINKDGLPNLSKHTALMKISNEIIRIKSKNEQLKKLLKSHDV